MNKYRTNSTGLFQISKFMKVYIGMIAFIMIGMMLVMILKTTSFSKAAYAIEGENLISSVESMETNDLQEKLDGMNKNLSAMVSEKKREDQSLREYEKTRAVYLEKTLNRGASGRGYLSSSLKQPSGLTADMINEVLEGTSLEGLGDAYIKAEKETGVSALFLLGVSAHESKWGNSKFARERNNIFGYKAYDSDPDKTERFSSKEECILVVAKSLSENYLVEDGKYYNGTTLKGVNKRYASDQTWYLKVNNVMEVIAASVPEEVQSSKL
ncbi:MAG: glucosaminidase domain-containing protein [Clostridia bacterium]|nr:glucosaminidase domain-containing protein [Clostridia bacterium]